MICKKCFKQISDKAVVCPHCGTQTGVIVPQSNSGYVSNENPVAIVGFVFSFLVAIVGLICSSIGYKRAKNEGAPYKGLALAGIIISAVSMAVGFILSIFLYRILFSMFMQIFNA